MKGGGASFVRRAAGFSLLEVVATMAIVALLLSWGMPAFFRAAAGARLDGAAGALESTIRFARRHAVTAGRPTWVLFALPDDDRSEMAGRAYAVFSVETSSGASDVFKGVWLSEWRTLPEGVAFDVEAGEGLLNVFAPSSQTWNGGFNRNRRLRVEGRTHAVLGFKPVGNGTGGYENEIYLTEGRCEAGRLIRESPVGRRVRIDAEGGVRTEVVRYGEDGKALEVEP